MITHPRKFLQTEEDLCTGFENPYLLKATVILLDRVPLPLLCQIASLGSETQILANPISGANSKRTPPHVKMFFILQNIK